MSPDLRAGSDSQAGSQVGETSSDDMEESLQPESGSQMSQPTCLAAKSQSKSSEQDLGKPALHNDASAAQQERIIAAGKRRVPVSVPGTFAAGANR